MKKKANQTKPKPWTRWEMSKLKRLYPMNHNQDLAKMLGRSRVSILKKAKLLGLKKDRAGGYHAPQPPQNENLWSEDEIKALRSMFLNYSDREIAAKVKRTGQAVQSKIKKLGLTREFKEQGLIRRTRGGDNRWTEEDIETLKKLYPQKSRNEIAQEMGRSLNSIAQMASKLKLSHNSDSLFKKKLWTAEDDAFLKTHIDQWPIEKIAKRLGRNPNATQRRAWNKHILRNCPNRQYTRQRIWTNQEIKQLEYWLPHYSNGEIAERLGRSLDSVVSKIKKHGLKRPAAWDNKSIAILKKSFPFQTNAEVARRLNKNPVSIGVKAKELGLRKSMYGYAKGKYQHPGKFP